VEVPTAIVAALALALAVLNGGVTWAVAKSEYYGYGQKAAQALIVWLVPFVGAIAVGVFLYSQRDNPVFDTRAYPEPDEKARPLEIEQAIHGHD
jgi:hypothetical protein